MLGISKNYILENLKANSENFDLKNFENCLYMLNLFKKRSINY